MSPHNCLILVGRLFACRHSDQHTVRTRVSPTRRKFCLWTGCRTTRSLFALAAHLNAIHPTSANAFCRRKATRRGHRLILKGNIYYRCCERRAFCGAADRVPQSYPISMDAKCYGATGLGGTKRRQPKGGPSDSGTRRVEIERGPSVGIRASKLPSMRDRLGLPGSRLKITICHATREQLRHQAYRGGH